MANTRIPRRFRRLQFGMRTLLIVMLLVALLIATDGFGVIGITYTRAILNEPLRNPIRVVRVDGNTLHLEDGRLLDVHEMKVPEQLETIIASSGSVVDLQPLESNSAESIVYVQRTNWISDRSTEKALWIPVLRLDIPARLRVPIGTAVAKRGE